MKQIIYTLLVALMLVGNASGGTVQVLEDVGFSANGKYFAYTTTEDNGMSDLTCRTTTFINTVRNQWVGRPYQICKFDGGEFNSEWSRKMKRDAKRAKREIPRLTKKLRINFKNDGQRVVGRAPFRYWKASGSASKEFARKGESLTFTSKWNNTRYRMRLSKKTVVSAKCDDMMLRDPPAVMSLRMRNLTSKKSTALQVDRSIPISRGCPFHYRLQNVYTHRYGRGKVVVALMQYFSPSIEGPDERYLVVSGRMN